MLQGFLQTVVCRIVRPRPGWMKKIVGVAAVAATIAATMGESRAQEPPADTAVPFLQPGKTRVFGVGSAIGGGVSVADAGGFRGSMSSPMFLGPTLELQVFLPREYSIDISLPVTNIAIGSAAAGGIYFNMDAMFNVNAGTGRTRFVFGPGLGFSVLAGALGSAGSFRIPGQIGFEVLSEKRSFGFKMLARPWAEFAAGSGGTAEGGGVLGALVFSGYSTSGGSVIAGR